VTFTIKKLRGIRVSVTVIDCADGTLKDGESVQRGAAETLISWTSRIIQPQGA
jgi:hypothetical protein